MTVLVEKSMASRTRLACALLVVLAATQPACETDEQATKADQTAAARPPLNYAAWLAPGPKKAIAVASFEDRTDMASANLGQAAAELLVGHLAASKGFVLVERARIDQVLAEHALSATGATVGNVFDEEQLGQLTDVNALIVGSVVDYGVKTTGTSAVVTQSKTQTARAKVVARMIDVVTGQVLDSFEGEGTAVSESRRVLGVGSSAGYDETLAARALDDAVAHMVERVVRSASQKVAWSARVAQVKDDTVFITAGGEHGIAVGQRFDVVQPGDAITDPQTGALLGRDEGRLKARLVVTQIMGDKLAKCDVSEKVETVARGDVVMLSAAPADPGAP